MKKLNKLYEAINDRTFKTTKTSEDSETGSISWDVEYKDKKPKKTNFKESYDDLNKLVKKITGLRGGMGRRDEELDTLILALKNIKNKYTRYLNDFHSNWKDS